MLLLLVPGAEFCDERVYVCLFVSVSVRAYLRNCTPDLHQYLCMLPVVVARSYSGGVAIGYVLPVLWMYICIFAHNGQYRGISICGGSVA